MAYGRQIKRASVSEKLAIQSIIDGYNEIAKVEHTGERYWMGPHNTIVMYSPNFTKHEIGGFWKCSECGEVREMFAEQSEGICFACGAEWENFNIEVDS